MELTALLADMFRFNCFNKEIIFIIKGSKSLLNYFKHACDLSHIALVHGVWQATANKLLKVQYGKLKV